MGCPYLDASCKDAGLLENPNAVLFAHNLGYNDASMFAAFANYTDPIFATEHQTILIQTLDAKCTFSARAASVIQGWEASKRTEFVNEKDWQSWWTESVAASSMVLDSSIPQTKSVVTCVTCSYNYWDDERTLVYAAQVE